MFHVAKPRLWSLGACLLLFVASSAQGQSEEELYQLRLRVDSLLKAGRYADGAAVCDKVVELTRQIDAGNLSIWLNNQAYLYKEAGNYSKLVPIYQEALEVSKKNFGAEHENTALIYDNLATAYWIVGRYSEAEPLFKQGLQLHEKLFGEQHELTSRSINNLAILYQDEGRYAEAEPLLRRALLISENVNGRNHIKTAPNVENMGTLYADQGRYAEAEPLLRRCLAITEANRPKGHPDIAKSLFKLSLLYYWQNRYADAEPYFVRCLAIREATLGKEHDSLAMLLNLWGLARLNQGKLAEAETMLRRALAIREKALGPQNAYVGQSLNNLARALTEQGRFDEAESMFRRGGEIRTKALGDNHPDVAGGWFEWARLKAKQNKLGEAEQYVNRALEIREKANLDPQERFKCYDLRAQLFWKSNRQADAIADLGKALTLAEAARGHAAGGDTGRATLFASYASAYERMVAWQIALGKLEDALTTIERSRARSLMDQLVTASVDFLAGLPADEAKALRERQRDAQTELTQLEKQAERVRSDKSLTEADRNQAIAELEESLLKAREEVIDAGVAIRNASPAYRQMVGQDFQPAPLVEMQTKLVGDAGLLLEYLLGDEAGYVVVIPPTGGKLRIEPLSITAEQAAVLKIDAGPLTAARMRSVLATADGTGVLQLLRRPGESKSLTDRLATLWQVLVPEQERKLLTSGKLKRWTIIPDASLAVFPFETLVAEKGEDLKYVLDLAPPLTTAPSATLLMNLAKAPTAKAQGVLSVGDVNYTAPVETSTSRGATSAMRTVAAGARYASVRGSLQPLPYTATESKWVTETFKKEGLTSGSLLKDNAREASVRTFGPNYEILHLACHGLVDQGNGNLFGALALTPGPSGAAIPSDDGYLTLQEIYGMNLHGTRLAILSACDTNYGPQQRGEGVWSLSRGFIVAGAQRVVASNWLVDDEAAATLITTFCVGVAKGQKAGDFDYAEALHKAKRYIREQEKWQSPYYWGTFVLVGPAQSLPAQ